MTPSAEAVIRQRIWQSVLRLRRGAQDTSAMLWARANFELSCQRQRILVLHTKHCPVVGTGTRNTAAILPYQPCIADA